MICVINVCPTVLLFAVTRPQSKPVGLHNLTNLRHAIPSQAFYADLLFLQARLFFNILVLKHFVELESVIGLRGIRRLKWIVMKSE